MRVLLADDSALFRRGLAGLLTDAGVEVVGQAGDLDALLDAARTTDADVIVTDVRMPPTRTTEGLQAAVTIRSERPDQAVLVLSQYIDVHYAADLLGTRPAGLGYLLKDHVADDAEFVEALERVRAGGTVVDPLVVSAALSARSAHDPVATLSDREREVLALMAEGRSNSAIAGQLYLSDKTVETHVRSIFQRLNLAPTLDDHRRVLAVIAYLRRPAAGA